MNEERPPSEQIYLEKRKDLLSAEQAFELLEDDQISNQARRKALQQEIAEISSLSESNSELNEDIAMVNELLQKGK